MCMFTMTKRKIIQKEVNASVQTLNQIKLKRDLFINLWLCIEEKSVVIDEENAFLAASVDGGVHDPSNTGNPVGNLQMIYKLFPEEIAPENNTRLLVTLATKTKNFGLGN